MVQTDGRTRHRHTSSRHLRHEWCEELLATSTDARILHGCRRRHFLCTCAWSVSRSRPIYRSDVRRTLISYIRCSTYFAKHRGIALGIVTSGNAAGGIVYPVIVRQLLGKVGFGWTVRVLGFINVATLLVVLALMKPRLPPRKSGPLVEWEAFRDTPYCLHVLGMCFLMPPVYCVFYYVSQSTPHSLTNLLN
jgi:hypothetical protein